MRRGLRRAGTALACACALTGSLAVGQAHAAALISATVSGPSVIGFGQTDTFTVAVSNNGDQTAHTVGLTIGFPDMPNEYLIGATDCILSASGTVDFGDIPAGGSAHCLITRHLNPFLGEQVRDAVTEQRRVVGDHDTLSRRTRASRRLHE